MLISNQSKFSPDFEGMKHKPSTVEIVIPEGLIKFNVSGGNLIKGFTSSIKASNVEKKIIEWKELGYIVKRLN